MHPDGYVEIRDRSKDVIISGGENIASVEVEQVLDSHPAVVESAVVGDARTRSGARCRSRSSPSGPATSSTRTSSRRTCANAWRTSRSRGAYVTGELPRTSTGKIRKNVLRERAREGDPSG